MRAHRPHNTHARESSLRKLTRINRWLIAGSVALTGLFVEAAAHAFPGKSAARSATAAKHAHAHHHHHVSNSSTHTQSLNPPAQPPQATTESSAPAEPTAPQEPAAPSEEAPHEAAPESAPVEPAPEPEATHESTPAPAEEAPPVVSGGS
jgi:outer membrane biosynthesis protein TonB